MGKHPSMMDPDIKKTQRPLILRHAHFSGLFCKPLFRMFAVCYFQIFSGYSPLSFFACRMFFTSSLSAWYVTPHHLSWVGSTLTFARPSLTRRSVTSGSRYSPLRGSAGITFAKTQEARLPVLSLSLPGIPRNSWTPPYRQAVSPMYRHRPAYSIYPQVSP